MPIPISHSLDHLLALTLLLDLLYFVHWSFVDEVGLTLNQDSWAVPRRSACWFFAESPQVCLAADANSFAWCSFWDVAELIVFQELLVLVFIVVFLLLVLEAIAIVVLLPFLLVVFAIIFCFHRPVQLWRVQIRSWLRFCWKVRVRTSCWTYSCWWVSCPEWKWEWSWAVPKSTVRCRFRRKGRGTLAI